MDFFEKTCKKSSKTEKVNITIEFYILEKSSYQISDETDNFDSLDQINPKRVFPI